MLRLGLVASTLVLAACGASAAPEIGAAAPAFTGAATTGETLSLDQFRGQTVVLEWTNHECPFVVKHYTTGNMQATQAEANAAGVVWLTVITSPPGKQGYVTAAEADALTEQRGATPDYVILDPSGEIGTAYAAKTTPQMFVIDPEGTLRYDGAIDDKPSANHATVAGATNYVLAALASMAAGEEVSPARTQPYGCSVKYP